jgi:hypothetical protein
VIFLIFALRISEVERLLIDSSLGICIGVRCLFENDFAFVRTWDHQNAYVAGGMKGNPRKFARLLNFGEPHVAIVWSQPK